MSIAHLIELWKLDRAFLHSRPVPVMAVSLGFLRDGVFTVHCIVKLKLRGGNVAEESSLYCCDFA